MNIAYLLDYFPLVSETFIAREIARLRKMGFQVVVYSRLDPRETAGREIVHKEAQELLKVTQYFPRFAKIDVLIKIAWSHAYLMAINPGNYFRTFRLAFSWAGLGGGALTTFFRSAFHAKILKQAATDHIHVHFALQASTYAMFISMLTRIPFSVTVHAHDIFIPNRAFLLPEKVHLAEFFSCISEYNKNYLMRMHPSLDQDKLKIIRCGVDPDCFTVSRSRRTSVFSILSVGRLTTQKGFKYLLDACGILVARNREFALRIIGEGEQRKELEEIIERNGLGKTVRLVGAKEQGEVAEALASADLFVLPCIVDERRSMMDGIPVAIMEAMACGIPIISTRLSGIPELIQDGCGEVVEPNDTPGLANAIIKMMDLSVEARQAIGNRGRLVVEREFNLQKEVAKLAELFLCSTRAS